MYLTSYVLDDILCICVLLCQIVVMIDFHPAAERNLDAKTLLELEAYDDNDGL